MLVAIAGPGFVDGSEINDCATSLSYMWPHFHTGTIAPYDDAQAGALR
jgi:hypothetical protein